MSQTIYFNAHKQCVSIAVEEQPQTFVMGSGMPTGALKPMNNMHLTNKQTFWKIDKDKALSWTTKLNSLKVITTDGYNAVKYNTNNDVDKMWECLTTDAHNSIRLTLTDKVKQNAYRGCWIWIKELYCVVNHTCEHDSVITLDLNYGNITNTMEVGRSNEKSNRVGCYKSEVEIPAIVDCALNFRSGASLSRCIKDGSMIPCTIAHVPYYLISNVCSRLCADLNYLINLINLELDEKIDLTQDKRDFPLEMIILDPRNNSTNGTSKVHKTMPIKITENMTLEYPYIVKKSTVDKIMSECDKILSNNTWLIPFHFPEAMTSGICDKSTPIPTAIHEDGRPSANCDTGDATNRPNPTTTRDTPDGASNLPESNDANDSDLHKSMNISLSMIGNVESNRCKLDSIVVTNIQYSIYMDFYGTCQF